MVFPQLFIENKQRWIVFSYIPSDTTFDYQALANTVIYPRAKDYIPQHSLLSLIDKILDD